MATNIWQGDVSTDPTVPGNWSLGWVPAAAEDILFDGTATDDCVGGDLTANVVASITIADDCTIDIGASAADALDFDCNGVVENHGTGTTFLNVKNSTEWNHYGSGTHSIDGIDNDALNIDASGATVTVGPISGTPAEFDTTMLVEAGTVTFDYVTDQAAADTDLTVKGGTVETNGGIDAAKQKGGTWTHEAGGMNNVTADGGKLKYNSATKIDGTLDIHPGGEITFEDNFRAVTVDDCHFHDGGGVLRDPHGRVTFANPFELHDCTLGECTIELPPDKKYTVVAI